LGIDQKAVSLEDCAQYSHAMKNNFILIIFLFFTAITARCQYGYLGYNLEEGNEYNNVLLYNSTLNYTYDDEKIKSHIYIRHEILYKVKELVDSNFVINMQFTNLSYERETDGTTISYCSEDEKKPESRILNLITKEKFEFIMDRKGNIICTSGMNKLYKKLIDSLIIDEKEQRRIYDFMVEAYGDSVFRNNLEMSMHIYPKREIGLGEKWLIKSKNSRYFHTEFACDYRINSFGDDFFVIKGNSLLNIDLNNETLENETEEYNFTGHLESFNYIDKKSGWIMTSNQHYYIEGTIIRYNFDSTEVKTIPLKEELFLTNTTIN